jgi:hypothetical protein
MEDLLKKLEKACVEMELISTLTEKYKNNEIVAQMLFNKKIEDGIIEKFGNASINQLKMMKSYKFKYYGKEITDKLIDQAILKNTRRAKLLQIKEISEKNI